MSDKHLWVIVVGALCACSGAKTPKVDPGAGVEAARPSGAFPGEGEGACGAADWVAAQICTDRECAAASLGVECTACLADAATCADAGDCKQQCVACLGEARCVFHETNVARAREMLEPALPWDYPASADVAFRTGGRAVREILGATPDGSLIVTREDYRTMGTALHAMVLDADERVLREASADCWVEEASPRGHWLVEKCGEELLLSELRTGFVRMALPQGANVYPWSFGGDDYLLVSAADRGWRLLDLREGGEVAIGREVSDAHESNASPSPDGALLAMAGVDGLAVFDAAPPFARRFLIEGFHPSRLGWESTTTLIATVDRAIRRYDATTGALVRETVVEEGIPWDISVAEPGAGVGTYGDDGLRYVAPNAATETRLRVLDPPIWTRSFGYDRGGGVGFEVLDDGQVLAMLLEVGMARFTADGKLVDDGRMRGPIRWVIPGASDDEVLVGAANGAWAVDLRDGKLERLSIPPEFRIVGARTRGDAIIALGGHNFDWLVQPSDRVWIGSRSGADARVIDVADEARAAMIGPDGLLHIVEPKRLVSYTLDPEPRAVRATKLPAGSTGSFSPEGDFVAVHEEFSSIAIRESARKPVTRILSTADHREVAKFDANACVFAARSNIVGCLGPPKSKGNVSVFAHEIPTRRLIRDVDIEIGRGSVLDVSDDGLSILLGLSDTGEARWIVDMWELMVADLGGRPEERYALLPEGAMLAVGPTYTAIVRDIFKESD